MLLHLALFALLLQAPQDNPAPQSHRWTATGGQGPEAFPLQENAPGEPFLVPTGPQDAYFNKTLQGVPLRPGVELDVYFKIGHGGISLNVANTAKDLRQLSSLAGHVRIHTGDEALAFVRCFTTPQTCKLSDLVPDWQALEVFRKQDAPHREFGVIDTEAAIRLGFQKPVVQWSHNHWIIKRFLILSGTMSHEQQSGHLYLSEETVDADGHYTHKVKKWFDHYSTYKMRLVPSEW